MLRYAIICISLSSPAMAEICDRSTYNLAEAEEGGPIQEARINFAYESGVIVHADGARETVYCIRNDESAPIWVKWHGPKPDLLFESYATGGGRKATEQSKRYELTTPDDRRIEYGLSKSYGHEKQGKTITFAGLAERPQVTSVQATPLDMVGRSMPEVLADARALDSYLEAYRNSPQGGNEVAIWSFTTNWLPADSEVLAKLAAGSEIENYSGDYFPISYGLVSIINIADQAATSSVFFWFGHFRADNQAFASAQGNQIPNRLSVVTAVGPFPGLAELKTDASYTLSDAGPSMNQNVLKAQVGGGTTAQIVPWTVGLAFDGIPFSAMQAELFSN
ncbi:MAG TPA: hypothetical protein VIZ90_17030 [Rhizobiaceae bacterium]